MQFFFCMIRVVSPIMPGRQLGRLAKIYFSICFLLVKYLFARFFSNFFDTIGTMSYTTLITSVAKIVGRNFCKHVSLC